MKLLAALLCLAVLPLRAEEFITGAQLMKACAATAPGERAACDGFISGAMDQVAVNPELRGKLCLPAGTKLGVLREGLVKFVRNRSEGAQGSGIVLVDEMVKSTYPCPAK